MFAGISSTFTPMFTTTINNLQSYLVPDEKKKSNRTKATWIDPICAMIALAILKIEPKGTKLSFNDNIISFNQPNLFQFYVRHHQGDSRSGLYNLTPAIYYSIKWLNIVNDRKYEIIFKMAKEGLSRMIEETYSDDLMTQQYLTTTHLRMLSDALDGQAILPENFRLPNHDNNPLNKHSYEIWVTKKSLDHLLELVLNCNNDLEAIKSALLLKMNEINRAQENYFNEIRTGLSQSSEEQIKLGIPGIQSYDEADEVIDWT